MTGKLDADPSRTGYGLHNFAPINYSCHVSEVGTWDLCKRLLSWFE